MDLRDVKRLGQYARSRKSKFGRKVHWRQIKENKGEENLRMKLLLKMMKDKQYKEELIKEMKGLEENMNGMEKNIKQNIKEAYYFRSEHSN